MCLHNLARAKVAFVDFMSLRQISLLLSLTKTYKASSAHFNLTREVDLWEDKMLL